MNRIAFWGFFIFILFIGLLITFFITIVKPAFNLPDNDSNRIKSICQNLYMNNFQPLLDDMQSVNDTIVRKTNSTITTLKLAKAEPSFWEYLNGNLERVRCDIQYQTCYQFIDENNDNKTYCYPNTLGQTQDVWRVDFEKWN